MFGSAGAMWQSLVNKDLRPNEIDSSQGLIPFSNAQAKLHAQKIVLPELLYSIMHSGDVSLAWRQSIQLIAEAEHGETNALVRKVPLGTKHV